VTRAFGDRPMRHSEIINRNAIYRLAAPGREIEDNLVGGATRRYDAHKAMVAPVTAAQPSL
jgi:hypothetical protein